MINEREPLFDPRVEISGEFAADWTPIALRGDWHQILGWSHEELLKTPFYKIIHPEDLEATIAMSGASPVMAKLRSWENRILCKNGSYKSILWHYYQEPTSKSFLTVAHDVTKIKVEKFLAERSQEVAKIGSWAVDFEANHIYWTSGTYKIFGLNPATFTPTLENIFSLYQPEDAQSFREYFAAATKEVVEAVREVEIFRPDGNNVSARVTCRVIRHNDVTTYMYGTIQDITTEKEQQKKLITAKDEAELANRIKSDFLANISHEIRTPMNSIIGMVELLNETGVDEEQRQYIGVLERASSNLLKILNDVLDLAKLEANQLKFESIAFNIHETIHRCADLFRHKIQEKGLDFKIELNDLHFPIMMGDPARIQQILNNLLANAVKFTEQGFINIRGKSTSEHIVIEVCDSGIGIPSESIPNLFRRFYQVDSSFSRKYGGTGLGLSICRELAEKMGGKIEVESDYGKGTTFRIYLKQTATSL